MFVGQYKFNSEIALTRNSYRESLKSPSKVSENAPRGGDRQLHKSNQPLLKKRMWLFVGTLFSTYYDRLIGHTVASFANLVQTGEQFKMVLRPTKSRTTKSSSNSYRAIQKDQPREIFPIKGIRKWERSSYNFRTSPSTQQPFVHPTPIFSPYPNHTI